LAIALCASAVVSFGINNIVHAASSYSVTETTATVGTATDLEIEYTVDTAQQTWADGDTLTITLPDNFPLWSSLSFTAEYDTDTTNNGSGEINIAQGTGNGQYSHNGARVLTIKWNLTGWEAVSNGASTIRVLITSATPMYADATSTFTFGGTTAAEDTNPTGTDDVDVSAADPLASIDVSAIDAVGESGNVVATFAIAYEMVDNDEVRITFPANFDVSGATYVSDTFSGDFDGCAVDGQMVKCAASGGIAAQSAATITISGIVSKYAADAATYTTVVYDISAGANIGSATDDTIAATTAATSLTATFDASDVATVGDASGQVTLALTFPVALATDDTIKMTFPANWDVSGLTPGAGKTYGLTNTVNVGVSSQVVTLTLEGAQTVGADTIEFETDTITPNYASTSQTVAILIEKSTGQDVVAASADAGVAVSIDDTVIADAAAALTLADGTVGATQNTTLGLTIPVALAASDTVAFTAPANLDVSSAAFGSHTFGEAGAFTCAAASQVVTCTATGVIDAGTGNIVMTGITGAYVATGATITSIAVHDDSEGVDVATDTEGTVTDTTAADPVSSIDVSAIAAVGSTGNVVVTFTLPYALADDDEVRLTFPANFDVSGAAYSADTFTGSFDACTVADQVVTCTANGAMIAESGKTLTISGITAAYVAVASTYTTTLYDISASANIGTASDDAIAETTVASANASVTLADATVGATQNTTLTLTIPYALATDDTVTFTMPDNLDVSGVAYSTDTFTGAGAFTCAAALQVITCTATGVIDAGTDGTIVMTGITGAYAATGAAVTSVAVYDTSAGANIATDATGTVTDTTAATTLTAAFDASAVATVGDAAGAVTLGLTFPVALAASDTIKLTFPANWNVVNLTTAAGLDNAVTVDIASQIVTLTLSGAQGATAETITFQTDTITPYYAKTGQTVAILIEKSGGEDVVAASADTGVAKSIQDTVVGDALASVTLADGTVGATQNTTLTLTLPVALAANDTVAFTMPANLDVSSAAFGSHTFGGAGDFACADSGQTVTCTADGVINAGAGTIVMTGITGRYASTSATVSGVLVYDNSASANLAADSEGTVTDTAAADPNSSIDVSAIAAVGTTGNVVVTLSAAYALAEDDELRLTFPANFNVASAAYSADTFTGDFDACSVAGQVVTCTVAAGGITAGNDKTITISGITAAYAAAASTYTTTLYDISASANIGTASDDAIAETTVASANASVTLADATVGATQNTTLTLTIPYALATDDTVTFTMPDNLDVSGVAYSTDTFTGAGAFTCAAALQVITCTATGVIDAGTDGTIVMTGITGAYAATGAAVTSVAVYDTSAGANIATDATGTVTDTTAATTLTAAFDASAVATVGDAAGAVTLGLTFPVALAASDTIKLTFPANWNVVNLTTAAGLDNAVTVDIASQIVTLTLSGAQGATAETITFQTDTITPYYAKTGQTVAILIEKSGGEDVVAASADTGVAKSIDDTVAGDAAAALTLANAAAGATQNTTLNITIPVDLANGDTVAFTAPANLDVSSVAFGSDDFGGAGEFTCADSGQVVTCTATGVIEAGTSNIVMSGITGKYAATGQTISSIVVYDTSASANIATDTSGTITNTTAADPSSSINVADITEMNQTGNVIVTFTIPYALADNDELRLTFPSNYNVASAAYGADTFTGGSFDACSASGQVVTCTANGAMSAESAKTVTLSGITAATVADASSYTTVLYDMSAGANIAYATDTIAATTPDVTDPNFSSWTLNMSTGHLVMTFDESVLASSLDGTGITIQDAATKTYAKRTLTGGTTASSNGTSIDVALTAADLNAIKAESMLAKTQGTSYLILTSAVITDIAGNGVTAVINGAGVQASSYTADDTAPTVSSTSPDHTSAQTDVAVTVAPTITFSKAMNALNSDSVYISTSATTDTGKVTAVVTSGSGAGGVTIATITPTSNLAASTAYYLHVTTAAKDTGDNALETQFNGTYSFTTAAAADTTAPTITLTSATPSQTGAAIIFQSNETGTAWIRYGIGTDYGNTSEVVSVTADTDKTVNLTGLTCNTAYHYSIYAQDATGNESHNLGDATVTTSACSATAVISSVAPSGITNTAATITWTTDVTATNNIVEYGTTQALGTDSSADANATSHSVSLSSLTANTTYYYRVKSTAGGSTTYSDILSFKTAAAATGVAATTQTLKSYATADGTYTNGWQFKFNVTINDETETYLKMKFADWTGASSLAAVSNMKIALTDDVAGVQAGTTGVAVGNLYATQSSSLTLVDEDPSIGGIQDTVYVYVKVPSGTSGGSYSTSYGIKTGTTSTITD